MSSTESAEGESDGCQAHSSISPYVFINPILSVAKAALALPICKLDEAIAHPTACESQPPAASPLLRMARKSQGRRYLV